MEGITIRHSEERKKWQSVKKRKELFEKYDYVCQECFNQFKYIQLNAEHTIPCILGGKEVKPLCRKCHKLKSKIDIKIIKFFKKMDFISANTYETNFYIECQKVIDLYTKIFLLSGKNTIKWNE